MQHCLLRHLLNVCLVLAEVSSDQLEIGCQMPTLRKCCFLKQIANCRVERIMRSVTYYVDAPFIIMKKTLRCDTRSLDARPGRSLSLSGGYIQIQWSCPLFGLYSIWPVSVTRYDTGIMAIYLALTISSDITKTVRACESCQKALWNREIGNLSFQLKGT